MLSCDEQHVQILKLELRFAFVTMQAFQLSVPHIGEAVAMSTKRSNDGTTREDDAKKSKSEFANHGNSQAGNPQTGDVKPTAELTAASPSSTCTDDSPYKNVHGPTKAGSQFR